MSRLSDRTRQTEAGFPYPLGATWDGAGTNFAVFSQHAAGVRLCLFDGLDHVEERPIEIRHRTNHVWHCYLAGVGPGQRYGFRVAGPYAPHRGHRFNDAKLLVDPYARALDGKVDWSGAVYAYRRGVPGDDRTADSRDDAAAVPKSVVVDGAFDWGADRPLRIPWNDTVIYELHVKGLTARHPDVPPELRGTFAGLALPAVTSHLKRLGVTAVELLPVHAFVDDEFLVRRGLRNYWGYSTLGFFAPENRYVSRSDPLAALTEFKAMVKMLHGEGLEVILDVVYNHTAEGNHLGPTLSFRGLDNRVYYRLLADEPRFNEDLTGTGNTLNASHPQVLQLIMDSLRYWVVEMHVDGFRFDLAPALGRDPLDSDPGASFFDAIHQDPVLCRVKLIAEPWDLGHGGYQVGRFPIGWSEWNDRFRDTVRGFWLGHVRSIADLPARISGSPDLFGLSGRGPLASINYVTAHDGFTVMDLVSYNEKHNEPNGEDNRDGADYNLSANHGVEGPTDDPVIRTLRLRQVRNLFATLLLARGVPMICGGDELARTQRGNNNAYCQDNEISWVDWDLSPDSRALYEFVGQLIRIRAAHPGLRDRAHPAVVESGGPAWGDPTWLRADGRELTPSDLTHPNLLAFAMKIAEKASGEDGSGRNPLPTDFLLVLFNGDDRAAIFRLPRVGDHDGAAWELVISTEAIGDSATSSRVEGEDVSLAAKSLALFRSRLVSPIDGG